MFVRDGTTRVSADRSFTTPFAKFATLLFVQQKSLTSRQLLLRRCLQSTIVVTTASAIARATSISFSSIGALARDLCRTARASDCDWCAMAQDRSTNVRSPTRPLLSDRHSFLTSRLL